MTKLKKGTRDLKRLSSAVLFSLLLLAFVYGAVDERQQVVQGEKSLYLQRAGDDLRSTLFEALEGAKESIDIALYALTDEGLIRLLKRRASEGVRVTLVYDREATKERRFGKIEAVEDHAKGLMHLKLFVVDGEVSFIGSANGSFASLRHYSNSLFRIDSKQVAEFFLKKIEALRSYERFSHQSFLIEEQPLEIWFLPDDPLASKRIVDLLRSAEKAIQVAMYTFTREDFSNELIAAKKRGIKVEVFLDRSSSESASKRVFERLKREGVFVKLSAGKALLHDKMCLIDDKILVQGSANWTKAAFTKNEDCFMVLHDLTKSEREKLARFFNRLQREVK